MVAMLGDAIIWLCRSPRRLAVSAVVILAVVLIGGSTLFGDSGSGPGGKNSGSGSVTATTTPVAQVPDAAPYVTTAVNFVEAWSRLKPGETAAQWQARLTPLVTPDLSRALKTTDPDALPGVGPSGSPVVRFVSQTSALIAVPLANNSSVLVTVVLGGVDPLVSDIQPNVGD